MKKSEAEEICAELSKRWPRFKYDVKSHAEMLATKHWDFDQAMEAIEYISEEGEEFPGISRVEKVMYVTKTEEAPGIPQYDDVLAKETIASLRKSMAEHSLKSSSRPDLPDNSRSTLVGFRCALCRDSGWVYALTDRRGYSFVTACKSCAHGAELAARDDIRAPYVHHLKRGTPPCGCSDGVREPGIPCKDHWPEGYRLWVANNLRWKTAPKPEKVPDARSNDDEEF